ncbi:YgfZ/GcvT domain-containing protein [Noviherbaspirillum massiliense]|uniref:CAF17-like 4Fe-4S cluster assembly/insertion protein YgfZ n=1 Tax=Noviherbaspirillum massiliense TaxID=1465823 RepID=UPI00037591C8|nr:folate-binding protein YgfZ [Noviherbaspirillum massiliense]
MNGWLQFLTGQGAQVNSGDVPEVAAFACSAAGKAASAFVAPLTDLGLMAFTGADAANFLHNQLTNDVEHLGEAEARLAGYCSPKGRLLATFLMWRTGDTIYLQVPREIQTPVQKRLQMFVLRAKVKVADATEGKAVLGLAGAQAAQVLAGLFPTVPAAPYQKTESEHGTLIRVADASGEPRYQWIADADAVEKAWPALVQALTPSATAVWRLSQIHAGVPQITRPTQEQFVPQMVNFELIGGVNFKKGCYPGQEIVARSQYLGKLKRRMVLASADAQDVVGAAMEVFSSADPEQPCGMIVNAERNASGGFDCLVEIKTAALQEGTVHVGSAAGPVLGFRALPYPLPEGA